MAIALTACNATAQNNDYGYPHTPVAFTSVKIAPNTFWGDRIKAAREVTIPLAFSKCETEGRYSNFVKAAHPSDDYDVRTFMGFSFDDTDVYKTIEGASYLLQTYPDKRIEQYIDSVLDIVAAAQEKDGAETAQTQDAAVKFNRENAVNVVRTEQETADSAQNVQTAAFDGSGAENGVSNFRMQQAISAYAMFMTA